MPLSVSFIGSGLFFGLLTEIFAIVNNLHLPPEQRILLSPVPVLDLVWCHGYRRPQHILNFFPLPQGHGSLRPVRTGAVTLETGRVGLPGSA